MLKVLKKIKNYVVTNKAKVISALSTISAIVVAASGFGGATATICSIVVAVISFLIYVLTYGIDEKAITLLTAAIKLILAQTKIDENNNIAKSTKELTDADIKAYLKDSLRK